MKIVLPWPDMSLMPNRKNGRHWAGTQAAKVRARQDGYYAAKEVKEGTCLPDGNIPLRITFMAPDKRHRDLDNLLAAMKASLDGIAQALGVDDKQFRPITVDAGCSENKTGRVIVEVGNGIA